VAASGHDLDQANGELAAICAVIAEASREIEYRGKLDKAEADGKATKAKVTELDLAIARGADKVRELDQAVERLNSQMPPMAA
jgi:chromosome segregation ATPase